MAPTPRLLLQDWIPQTIEESRLLYERLVEAGVSRQVARNTIGRLQTLPAEAPLSAADIVERSRLRTLFASLGEPPWPRAAKLRPLSSALRVA